MSFAANVVLITGAASGIGRATAIALHALSATLVLCDISEKGLAETNLICGGGKHFASIVDVGDGDAVKAFIEQVIESYGHIDHVFNNAGVNPTPRALTETSNAYWDKLVNTNLRGVFNVTRACIPHLPHHSGSSFVNVSSIMGTRGSAENAVYCATKWAVIGFSKSMALELGSKGIRVNVVAPGYIDTPTNSSVVQGPQAVKEAEKGVALGRMGTADEVADVVVWLMSDAARYMNGSVVEVNGGM